MADEGEAAVDSRTAEERLREPSEEARIAVLGEDGDLEPPSWEEIEEKDEELRELLEKLKKLNDKNYEDGDEQVRLADKLVKTLDKVEAKYEEVDKLYTEQVAAKIAEVKEQEAAPAEAPAEAEAEA